MCHENKKEFFNFFLPYSTTPFKHYLQNGKERNNNGQRMEFAYTKQGFFSFFCTENGCMPSICLHLYDV